jgi:HAD superfamily hydrolase (TIGR01509 family)
LAIINNGNTIALKYWKEQFDFSIFDLYINSAKVGIKKPDPKIFLVTCRKLVVKPNECLFMDDSLENIKAAKKLGMQVIWWNKEVDKINTLNKFMRCYRLE